MAHMNDEMRNFYTRLIQQGYMNQPYLQFEQIGTGLRLLNSTSSVKTFSQPNFANRIIVFYDIKGTVSSGTLRLECAVNASVSGFAAMNSDAVLSAANSNSCVRVFNEVGPFHFVRVRVSSAINGGGSADVYIAAAR